MAAEGKTLYASLILHNLHKGRIDVSGIGGGAIPLRGHRTLGTLRVGVKPVSRLPSASARLLVPLDLLRQEGDGDDAAGQLGLAQRVQLRRGHPPGCQWQSIAIGILTGTTSSRRRHFTLTGLSVKAVVPRREMQPARRYSRSTRR